MSYEFMVFPASRDAQTGSGGEGVGSYFESNLKRFSGKSLCGGSSGFSRAVSTQPDRSAPERISGTSISCFPRSTASYAARSYSGVCGNGRHASNPTLVPR